eukprot:g4886.t1
MSKAVVRGAALASLLLSSGTNAFQSQSEPLESYETNLLEMNAQKENKKTYATHFRHQPSSLSPLQPLQQNHESQLQLHFRSKAMVETGSIDEFESDESDSEDKVLTRDQIKGRSKETVGAAKKAKKKAEKEAEKRKKQSKNSK